jgi:hypothetical protein
MKEEFTLWLEFEEYADPYPSGDDDPLCDFCNAMVTVGEATYAMNIWTFAFVDIARRFDVAGAPLDSPNIYLLPPDLLVERLDRATIERSVRDLLSKGELPANWRVAEEE